MLLLAGPNVWDVVHRVVPPRQCAPGCHCLHCKDADAWLDVAEALKLTDEQKCKIIVSRWVCMCHASASLSDAAGALRSNPDPQQLLYCHTSCDIGVQNWSDQYVKIDVGTLLCIVNMLWQSCIFAVGQIVQGRYAAADIHLVKCRNYTDDTLRQVYEKRRALNLEAVHMMLPQVTVSDCLLLFQIVICHVSQSTCRMRCRFQLCTSSQAHPLQSTKLFLEGGGGGGMVSFTCAYD